MVVVVLMALLTSAAALTFARPLRVARWEQVVAQLQTMDRSAREAALRFDREVTIGVDLTEKSLSRREGRDVKWQQSLPRAFRIEEVRAADGSGSSSGLVEIPVSPLAITPTYAVRLVGPEAGEDRWLVFTGLTGQVTQVDDAAGVDSMFASIEERRRQ